MTARVILYLLQASLARPGLEGGPLGRVGRPLARPGVEAHVPVGSLPRPGVESGHLPLLHLSHGSEIIKDLMLLIHYLMTIGLKTSLISETGLTIARTLSMIWFVLLEKPYLHDN